MAGLAFVLFFVAAIGALAGVGLLVSGPFEPLTPAQRLTAMLQQNYAFSALGAAVTLAALGAICLALGRIGAQQRAILARLEAQAAPEVEPAPMLPGGRREPS